VGPARQPPADPDWFLTIRAGHVVRRGELTGDGEGLR
jgi:hypothetical protein